jgi:hypothetical protein
MIFKFNRVLFQTITLDLKDEGIQFNKYKY